MRAAARPIRRKSPRRCSRACCSRPPIPAISCSIRSSAPAPPARSPSGSGAIIIGIERDPGYAAAARERIAAIEPLPDEAVAARADQAQRAAHRLRQPRRGGPRHAGRDADRRARRHRRSCAPTARWRSAPIVGSIHKIGALVQGLPACNGWTFWHFETARAARRSTICARRRARACATPRNSRDSPMSRGEARAAGVTPCIRKYFRRSAGESGAGAISSAAHAPGLRVERIVSFGQASPPGFPA